VLIFGREYRYSYSSGSLEDVVGVNKVEKIQLANPDPPATLLNISDSKDKIDSHVTSHCYSPQAQNSLQINRSESQKDQRYSYEKNSESELENYGHILPPADFPSALGKDGSIADSENEGQITEGIINRSYGSLVGFAPIIESKVASSSQCLSSSPAIFNNIDATSQNTASKQASKHSTSRAKTATASNHSNLRPLNGLLKSSQSFEDSKSKI
jgi:hypothetical protein